MRSVTSGHDIGTAGEPPPFLCALVVQEEGIFLKSQLLDVVEHERTQLARRGLLT